MGFPLPSGRLCKFTAHTTAEAIPQAKFKVKVGYRTVQSVRMSSHVAPEILLVGQPFVNSV